MDHQKNIQAKIFPGFDSFKEKLEKWKNSGETIVFTNGCFDIVHYGHVDSLIQSAAFGSKLIVGLNSDTSVKLLKGDLRPVISEDGRALLIASFQFVDAVILFSEETPYQLISEILPDVLVKGEDYQIHEIAGFDVVLENGGRVETIQLVPGISTTSIISKLKEMGNE